MRVSPRSPVPLVATGGAAMAAGAVGFAGATASAVPLVAVVGALAAVVTLIDWSVGVPILLVVSVVDGFLKHLTASPATFVLKDAMLGLIALGLLLRFALHREPPAADVRWRGTVVFGAYVAFLVTQLVNPAFGLAGAFSAFRAHAFFAVLFVVGALYFRRGERLARTANLAIALCAVAAIGALVQHVMGDRWLALSSGMAKASLHYTVFPSIEAKASGAHGAVYRMYGTLVDPAALGMAATYGILFAVAALGRVHGWWRALVVAAIPLLAVALVLSQARAAMGGLALGLLVLLAILVSRKATRGFAIGGVLLIALAVPAGVALTHGSVLDRIFAPDQVEYAAGTRDYSENRVLVELPRYPFGHGLGATGAGGGLRVAPGLAVDNVYFATLFETGIVGFALFLALQGTLLVLGTRAALHARTTSAFAVFAGIVAAQCAMLASCWFSQGTFDYAPLAQFFWLFAGAVSRGDAWA